MNNKNVKYYIFGILSYALLFPVIEELVNVIQSWIQVLLIKPSRIVLEANKDLAELQNTEECQQTDCVGFQMPSEEDYEDYDE